MQTIVYEILREMLQGIAFALPMNVRDDNNANIQQNNEKTI